MVEQLFGASIVLAVVVIVAVLATRVRAATRRAEERRRIWEHGVAAQAQVVRVRPTGVRINHHPQIDLTLDVSVPGRAPYRTDLIVLISNLSIPQVQPGCVLEAKVDPLEEHNVVIEPDLAVERLV